MKIGIIKEGRKTIDTRTPLSPRQCKKLETIYQNLEFIVEPSDIRSYSDEEYKSLGINVSSDLSQCDIILGIKEVPVERLIDNKTYLFFSHTVKQQEQNKKLLQTVIEKNIKLIDFELITNSFGERTTAFGYYAGLAGTYNGIKAYGIKNNLFKLKPASSFEDSKEMLSYLKGFKLPKIKVVVTGYGRVAMGAKDVLEAINTTKITPDEFINNSKVPTPVFTILDPLHFNSRIDGDMSGIQHFYKNPSQYKSIFNKYYRTAEILISTTFWNPQAPLLFTKDDMQKPEFNIKVIADITCDINGSIPSTIRSSTIKEPFYDFNPKTLAEELPYSNDNNITVMSIDNVSCELSREASEYFGNRVIKHVIPELMNKIKSVTLDRATIAENGTLTERFKYLEKYTKTN